MKQFACGWDCFITLAADCKYFCSSTYLTVVLQKIKGKLDVAGLKNLQQTDIITVNLLQ